MNTWPRIWVDKILRESPKAILYLINGEEHWIPRSQQIPISKANPNGAWEIHVSSWWLEKNHYEYLRDYQPLGQQKTGSETTEPSLLSAQKIYRKLAAKYHPDRSPATAEIMKDINELWQAILKENQRRN